MLLCKTYRVGTSPSAESMSISFHQIPSVFITCLWVEYMEVNSWYNWFSVHVSIRFQLLILYCFVKCSDCVYFLQDFILNNIWRGHDDIKGWLYYKICKYQFSSTCRNTAVLDLFHPWVCPYYKTAPIECIGALAGMTYKHVYLWHFQVGPYEIMNTKLEPM